jgi:hypothetical protein
MNNAQSVLFTCKLSILSSSYHIPVITHHNVYIHLSMLREFPKSNVSREKLKCQMLQSHKGKRQGGEEWLLRLSKFVFHQRVLPPSQCSDIIK